MKYEINQLVYSIASRGGKLEIQEMHIDKIALYRKDGVITYSGVTTNDPEQIPNSLEEDKLFPSREEALNEIQRQLSVLRGQHA